MNYSKSELWLKKHYKNVKFVYFKYFIGCYFLPGFDYSELDKLIKEYKEMENSEMQEGLLREILLLKEKDDWYYIQNFVGKHGLRHLSHEKLKNMFNLIIETLESKG